MWCSVRTDDSTDSVMWCGSYSRVKCPWIKCPLTGTRSVSLEGGSTELRREGLWGSGAHPSILGRLEAVGEGDLGVV